MEIMLLRHGESEGNAQGRMQGRSDYPLSPLGRAQAVRPEPVVDEDLPEIAAGSLEDLNESEIRAAHPVFMQRSLTETGDFSDYGGESYADVQERLKRLMMRLQARHRERSERVLLVGHGGFHYQLAKALLCEPVPRVCILKMGNCTASLLRLRERRGLYMAELVFHVPVELMGGPALPASSEGAARLFR
jgi:broad specificity phosphatase PhoE